MGATGNDGAMGATGNDGAMGATGNDGAMGATGNDGAMGATGNDGAMGATGAAGAMGATGANGLVTDGGGNTFSSTALSFLSGGTGNTAVGDGAGNGYTSTESNNIVLGTAAGDTGVSNEIIIGNGQTAAYFAGIYGVTANTSSQQVVTIDSTGFLGSLDSSLLVGPMGATGNDGAMGATGAAGATGLDGATGLTGATGVDGATGAGVEGATGVDGATGATGAPGTGFVVDTPNGNVSASDALLGISGGTGNSAIGSGALNSVVTGSLNTAVGVGAGSGLTGSDSDNIDIGNPGAPGDNGIVRVGDAGTNKVFLNGVFGKTTIDIGSTTALVIDNNGNIGTVASSQRYKKDIQDMGSQSEAILALRPVTFAYKTDGNDRKQYGLIAEEVAKVAPGLVVHDKSGRIMTVRYDQVNAMLLNEFQKQHATIEEQAKTISEQQAALKAVMDRLSALEKAQAGK